MKLLSLNFFIGLSCLLFFSCKKDNSTNNNSSGARPKTYTEDITSSIIGNSSITYTLTYDGNGRLTSLTAAGNPPPLKFIYQYGTNSFTMDLYDYGALSIHEEGKLNADSYLDSTFQYNDTNDTSTEKYIYNGNKQLVKVNEYSYTTAGGAILDNTTNYTYDSDGNIITESDLNQTITYDYYTDLTIPFSFDRLFVPLPKNLPKTVTVNSGGSIESAVHTYTFNSQHRLLTDKIVASNGDIYLKTYTY